MLTSITGIYRAGKIEFTEPLPMLPEETSVIVTFLEPRGVDLRARGLNAAQAAQLRVALAPFAEEWESPEMAVYDDYDHARLSAR